MNENELMAIYILAFG